MEFKKPSNKAEMITCDKLVYQLYGLTDDEIKIIEESLKN